MLELLLIRHGQTDWNVEKRVMGRQPIPLNVEGRSQVRLLAKGLKDIPIHAVYTSPTKRTMQTAQLILKGREPVPLIQDEGLTEVDFGEWLNMNFSQLFELEKFHDYLKRPSICKIPGGETVIDVQKRGLQAIERIKSKHMGQRVIAISHADVIRTILVALLGISFDDWQRLAVDSGSMSVIHISDDRTRVVTINCQGNFSRYFKL